MWYDEMDGPGPIDSYDAFQMGLRPARCNGCRLAQLEHELGERFLLLGNTVYEYDAEPAPGQAEPTSHQGRPIRFHAWFMSLEHSDECYNWQPPGEEAEDEESDHTVGS
ncbi:MAG: hypothetical protein GWN58_11195 [Anaerolineae bacterium]|nr:hypothetical protein [Anaerolineae bacterium]